MMLTMVSFGNDTLVLHFSVGVLIFHDQWTLDKKKPQKGHENFTLALENQCLLRYGALYSVAKEHNLHSFIVPQYNLGAPTPHILLKVPLLHIGLKSLMLHFGLGAL